VNSEDLDMKIIDTVCEEELFPGIDVLYIPEEYMFDKHKYYHDYLYSGKEYSYIFGHGIISEGMPMINMIKESSSDEKKVPIFNARELSSVSKFCMFGHYHLFKHIEGGCYYIGQLFMDSFGPPEWEDQPRGYGIIEGDEFTFKPNPFAYKYKTYIYNDDSEIYNSSENLINEIDIIRDRHKEIFNNEAHGKIRLIFNLPDNIDASFKENLRNMLFNDKHISYITRETSDMMAEIQESIEDEYDFILDPSLPISDKIQRYIYKRSGVYISPDRIEYLITHKYTDIRRDL
jgi:hypothetical protein